MDYKKIIAEKFPQNRIIVLGDIMVDEYITGKVKRISPEAPVPVLDFAKRSLEAGGACNVANNVRSLGAQVSMVGIIGSDYYGQWLISGLQEKGIDTDGIVTLSERPTTVKTRYATKGQQLLRVDNEVKESISIETQYHILEYLRTNISDTDGVILSDYCKGFFADAKFVSEIIRLCNENHVFVSIDSKSKAVEAFEGADFVKPNNVELEAAVGFSIKDDDDFNQAGRVYLEKSKAKTLVVTRGAKGISIFHSNGITNDFPAKDVQVYDVCGAGDTVISTATMACVSGLTIEDAIILANYAAGVVIMRVGTYAIHADELIRSLDEI